MKREVQADVDASIGIHSNGKQNIKAGVRSEKIESRADQKIIDQLCFMAIISRFCNHFNQNCCKNWESFV